jgi:hypothetical protein
VAAARRAAADVCLTWESVAVKEVVVKDLVIRLENRPGSLAAMGEGW